MDSDEELIRGICYDNSGVLDIYANGSGFHGDNFAAAQVTLDKSDGETENGRMKQLVQLLGIVP